ncbi:MAG: hypothetical protein NTX88_05900 [Candidatus Atribacteria bacterium]|nr:hypothetical protein [Candidatus Atribacteria bacterium]
MIEGEGKPAIKEDSLDQRTVFHRSIQQFEKNIRCFFLGFSSPPSAVLPPVNRVIHRTQLAFLVMGTQEGKTKRNEGSSIGEAEGEHPKTPMVSPFGVVEKTSKAFDVCAPGPLIRGIIHHPRVSFRCGKGEKGRSHHFGTEEKQEFSPVIPAKLGKAVDGVFSSLKRVLLLIH